MPTKKAQELGATWRLWLLRLAKAGNTAPLRFHSQPPRERDADVEKRTPPYWTSRTIRHRISREDGELSTSREEEGDMTVKKRRRGFQTAGQNAASEREKGSWFTGRNRRQSPDANLNQRYSFKENSVSLWRVFFSLLTLAIPLDLLHLHRTWILRALSMRVPALGAKPGRTELRRTEISP